VADRARCLVIREVEVAQGRVQDAGSPRRSRSSRASPRRSRATTYAVWCSCGGDCENPSRTRSGSSRLSCMTSIGTAPHCPNALSWWNVAASPREVIEPATLGLKVPHVSGVRGR
jgi:hypothetical protein